MQAVTSKFKIKLVLEGLKERQTVKELAQKFGITPQQIGTWKRLFQKEADTVFSKRGKTKKIR
ncbi:transposase [Zunongwangia atlantica]|uniref:Transposase n=1 Tax=Zunongwangia atlantica 22II14-10F7 TaxID=1185767 RepID=A0A1Y1T2D6_9FLAO|nr:transposase [Zunongwangia atlantica 22II14-10F7]